MPPENRGQRLASPPLRTAPGSGAGWGATAPRGPLPSKGSAYEDKYDITFRLTL